MRETLAAKASAVSPRSGPAPPWEPRRYRGIGSGMRTRPRGRAELAKRFAPPTANKALSALRGVLKEAWLLGLMDAERYQRAEDLKTIQQKLARHVNTQTTLRYDRREEKAKRQASKLLHTPV